MRRSEAFFLALAGGGRFCLFHPAADSAGGRGAVVYVHPFAEELNKSRRMAALQARALAETGLSVLQLDLFGCGDSAGDFGDATWRVWIDDVVAAAAWVRARTGHAPSLWGLRAGCLLVVEASTCLDPAPDLLFWQPVISGSQHLQQFLRLKVANQLVGSDAGERIGTKELREQLGSGATVEVAGYALSPALALGMELADLKPPPAISRVVWLEVSGSGAAEISPAGSARVEGWRASGHDVAAAAVAGLPFWQTQEIAECAALVDATNAAVARWCR